MTTHDDLFPLYVAELRAAKEAAEHWWVALLAQEAARTQDRTKAEQAVRERWPFGPTSHPWVITVFRKYYLLCEALNRELGEPGFGPEEHPASEEHWGEEREDLEGTGYVSPRDFTLGWLAGEGMEDLEEFTQFMVFVPIGIKNDVLV